MQQIIKRDFSKKPFNIDKITAAILKSMKAVNCGSHDEALNISLQVYKLLALRKEQDKFYLPTVEEVQDIVETKLMESKFTDAAKAYILYRSKRSQERKKNIWIHFRHMCWIFNGCFCTRTGRLSVLVDLDETAGVFC